MPEFPEKIVAYFDDDGILCAVQPGTVWAATHPFRVYEITAESRMPQHSDDPPNPSDALS